MPGNSPVRDLLLCCCLAAATAAVYLFGGISHADFVYFDDGKYVYFNGGGGYIEQNPRVCAGLTPDSVRWAFHSMEQANWHPLTWLSHMLDVTMFGLWAGGHHLTSLVLHCANAVLLFLVLKSLSGAVWPSAAVAALFALHPLHVESAAWVAERKDVLSTLFGLLALGAYAAYARRPMSAGRTLQTGALSGWVALVWLAAYFWAIEPVLYPQPVPSGLPLAPTLWVAAALTLPALVAYGYLSWRYLLVIAGLAVGLMAKPMLVTLPFVCLLLDYWPLGRVPAIRWPRGPRPEPQPRRVASHAPPRRSRKARRGNAARTAPPAQEPSPLAAVGLLVLEKLPLFLLAAASCVVTYIAQQRSGAVVPAANLPFFPQRIENVLTAYVRYLGKTLWPEGLASLYPLRGENLHAGAALAAAALLVAISAAVAWAARRGRRYLAVGWLWYLGMLVPVIGLVQVGDQSMADRYTYLPSVGLFVMAAWGTAEATARWPQRRLLLACLAVVVLLPCMVLTARQVGYWADSETLFRRTLSVTTDNPITHNNLGNILTWRGRDLHDSVRREAVQQYLRAIQIDPNYAEPYNNLGNTLKECNRVDEAIEQYRKAIQANPNYFEALCSLAYELASHGGRQEAAGKYGEAVAHFGEAVAHYEKAIRVKPDDPLPKNNLLVVLLHLARIRAAAPDAAQRDGNEAVRLAQRACQLAGGQNPELLDTLAMAYAEAGSFDQAAATAHEAIRLASAAGHNELAEGTRSRLALYVAHRPYRLP
jgi:tetratricopeptide (TPR) repeat protein